MNDTDTTKDAALQSSPEQAAIEAMAHPRSGPVRWVCPLDHEVAQPISGDRCMAFGAMLVPSRDVETEQKPPPAAKDASQRVRIYFYGVHLTVNTDEHGMYVEGFPDLSELRQEIEERLRADATATAEHARDLMRRHD